MKSTVMSAPMANVNPEPKIKTRVRLEREPDRDPQYCWISDKTEVMVFRDPMGKVRILTSLCPHMGAQLVLKDHSAFCPWHGLAFDLTTLKSNHHRYRQGCEHRGDYSNGELVIYE